MLECRGAQDGVVALEVHGDCPVELGVGGGPEHCLAEQQNAVVRPLHEQRAAGIHVFDGHVGAHGPGPGDQVQVANRPVRKRCARFGAAVELERPVPFQVLHPAIHRESDPGPVDDGEDPRHPGEGREWAGVVDIRDAEPPIPVVLCRNPSSGAGEAPAQDLPSDATAVAPRLGGEVLPRDDHS